ncbi:ferredoxin [Leucobacter weissii]|uniref:Ferredoxin n=1 Tax=Leucobacter weissii TaxID=1983706 RepID=A0A939MLY3_9MICO|nr:ferredoxin [Leucobacter weissii]MBO1902690.1 ferredoxin [Leucobacter weissii]
MRIDVIMERCEGHGLCAEVSPELYALDDEGYVVFEHDGADVPDADRAAAAAGARVCPVAALLVRGE